LSFYATKLKNKGELLLSGFFTTDNDELILAAREVGLIFVKSKNKDNWSMLKFIKN
jgi:ribosomal protein L11 methyltransferase